MDDKEVRKYDGVLIKTFGTIIEKEGSHAVIRLRDADGDMLRNQWDEPWDIDVPYRCVDSVVERKESLEEEVARLRVDNERLASANKDYGRQNEILTLRVRELNGRVEELVRSTFETDNLCEKVEKFIKENADLYVENRRLNEKIDQLYDTVDRISHSPASESIALKERINGLMRENTELYQQVSHLKIDLQKAKEENLKSAMTEPKVFGYEQFENRLDRPYPSEYHMIKEMEEIGPLGLVVESPIVASKFVSESPSFNLELDEIQINEDSKWFKENIDMIRSYACVQKMGQQMADSTPFEEDNIYRGFENMTSAQFEAALKREIQHFTKKV